MKRTALARFLPHVGQYEHSREASGAVINDFNLFRVGVEPDGTWYGEDVYFCKAWRAMGGEIWIDPYIEFSHAGRKKWVNSLGPTLDATIEAIMAQQQAANDAAATEGAA